MSEPQRIFEKVSQVREFLLQQGYRFGKTKLYDDCNAGKLSPKDGIFTEETTLAYAKAHLKLDEKLDLQKIRAQRQEIKNKKEKWQAEWWETKTRRERGELVPADEFERALVKRAVALKIDFINFAKSNTAKIIQITGGDRGRAPDLKVYLISEFENIFDNYAKNPVLEVPIAARD